MHRPYSRRRAAELAIALLALVGLTALVLPEPALATTAGSGGWYWPVGTENFQGWDGWWVYRAANHSWHMAQDMPSSVGHAVYAIGSGTVIESKADAGYGGVIVVLHSTAAGEPFKAVYGHIRRATGTSAGSKVRAGQVVGYVNSCRHLHFGIHPGRAYPSDNNPFRGHTYDRSKTYGWVDCVAYLTSHPRVLAYAAPPLPEVVGISTDATPTVLGVAEGRVYWTVDSDDAPLTFARSLEASDTAQLAAEEPLPDGFETAAFRVLNTPVSFSVLDARPLLTESLSCVAPRWGASLKVTGRVTNAAGAAFVGASVMIETSSDGSVWAKVATAKSGLTGMFSGTFVPVRRVQVRARFVAPALYAPAESAATTVAPRPAISTPCVPPYIRAGRSFAARGSVRPRHAAGTGATDLRAQRLVSGTWMDAPLTATTYSDITGGSSYAGTLRLRAGSWRIRAETPADSAHAAHVTAWRAFTVH